MHAVAHNASNVQGYYLCSIEIAQHKSWRECERQSLKITMYCQRRMIFKRLAFAFALAVCVGQFP